MYILMYSVIVLIATLIGAITGLGGGIIIKPAFDLVHLDNTVMISVYSTIAVFTMCIVSIYKTSKEKNRVVNRSLAGYLAVGSVVGGLMGDLIFKKVVNLLGTRIVSLSQSLLLIIILSGILIYALFQKRVKTMQVTNPIWILFIGLGVGAISVFLGIGGGPLNIALLVIFFSMQAKEAAFYSIVMIFFAQVSKIVMILSKMELYKDRLPIFLCLMIFAVLGGYLGTRIQKKLSHQQVSQLYNILMLLLLVINIFNFFSR